MINYCLLAKPKIILGNLITAVAGFLLASKGNVDFWLFFATLIGLALIIASACVSNNFINRQLDKKMQRTRNRALVTGLISGRNAIVFAVYLGIMGNLILILYTNILTVMLADIGFFVYVILYSFWKCRTIYGTAIGSISGAIPPVVGYCAVSNHFDLGALILFIIMIFWQMPHFFALVMYHFDDYLAAKIPVLPVIKGILRTKIHMMIYIIGFILTASMLTLFNYTGYFYLIVTTSIGLTWLGFCLKGYKSNNDQLWGKHMFHLSLVMIIATCFVISLDVA
jgi:protoheme IX farnesyltransferase